MTPQQEALKTHPSENGRLVIEEHEPSRPITIGKNDYVLKEMDDKALGQWMKLVGKRVVKDSKGNVIKENYTGFHADLIALCLHDSNNNLVPKSLIQSWGAKTQNTLFEICQEMNGLSGRLGDEEKNLRGADMDGGNEE